MSNIADIRVSVVAVRSRSPSGHILAVYVVSCNHLRWSHKAAALITLELSKIAGECITGRVETLEVSPPRYTHIQGIAGIRRATRSAASSRSSSAHIRIQHCPASHFRFLLLLVELVLVSVKLVLIQRHAHIEGIFLPFSCCIGKSNVLFLLISFLRPPLRLHASESCQRIEPSTSHDLTEAPAPVVVREQRKPGNKRGRTWICLYCIPCRRPVLRLLIRLRERRSPTFKHRSPP